MIIVEAVVEAVISLIVAVDVGGKKKINSILRNEQNVCRTFQSEAVSSEWGK